MVHCTSIVLECRAYKNTYSERDCCLLAYCLYVLSDDMLVVYVKSYGTWETRKVRLDTLMWHDTEVLNSVS
jgi:hypothetical protein